MSHKGASGTEGYAEEAEALVRAYESITFADVHEDILALLPRAPSFVLDVGAGTGRDAAALVAMGHSVTAVEPTTELRRAAVSLHASPRIEWLDDSLPDLAHVVASGRRYDLVMLTAVWMHLDAAERRRAMPRVAGRLRPKGVMMMTLRHGPVPPGRRMFEVTAEETIVLAMTEGLRLLRQGDRRDGAMRRPGVSWTRLVFVRD